MVFADRCPSRWQRVLLIVIVLGASVLSTFWAFLVPIYQSPDEAQHLDYALALIANGGLFDLQHRSLERSPSYVHPLTFFLAERTGADGLIKHPEKKMSIEYGTEAYYDSLARDAPDLDSIKIEAPPALALTYPVGYYSLLAAWLSLLRVYSSEITILFFGARLFSVLLLACTLVLIHATAREMRLSPGLSLAVTAAIGFFPMTSFVSSYVQPDNLGFTLVSLCQYLALRARRLGCPPGCLAFLGLAMAALLITKVQFFLCVFLAVGAMLLTEMAHVLPTKKRFAGVLALWVLPPVAMWLLHRWSLRGSDAAFTKSAFFDHSLAHVVREFISQFHEAIEDYYWGWSHRSFWGIFGWMDTPLVIGGDNTTSLIHALLHGVASLLLALTLIRLFQVTSRLLRLCGRGKIGLAVRIACSNVVLNSYFAFTLLMIALYIYLQNSFKAQGRNWLPFLLPIFLTSIIFTPKVFRQKKTQCRFALAIVGGVLLYDLVGGAFAITTLDARYYRVADAPTRAIATAWRLVTRPTIEH